ncbi:hypothetical protein OROMI_003900 [Orobanche minor]
MSSSSANLAPANPAAAVQQILCLILDFMELSQKLKPLTWLIKVSYSIDLDDFETYCTGFALNVDKKAMGDSVKENDLVIKRLETHGCSGGPVFNSHGKVVGMLVGDFDACQIAIHVTMLKDFVKEFVELRSTAQGSSDVEKKGKELLGGGLGTKVRCSEAK